jgi:nicotinamide-nucleotide amidase
LGPTADDLTRQALADVAGVELVQDDASLAHIKALFAKRKREMPPANVVQAMFPRGSRPIFNPNGSAPGIDMVIDLGGKAAADGTRSVPATKRARVFALPGVPAEMKEMWAATVRPAIQEHIGVTKVIAHYRIKCFGVGESDLEAMLPDIIARDRYPLVGITVHQATITLRLTAEGETTEAAREAMQPTIETIQQCLGDLIFGYEDDELQDVVVRMLRERKEIVTVEEFATRGLLCSWLSQCEDKGPEVFICGVVHGGPVDLDIPATYRPTIAGIAKTHYLLIVRSVAKETGLVTVEIGDHTVGKVFRREFAFSGHPEIIRPRLAKSALNFLRLHLLGKA